jgi:hypothetical protein
MPHWLRKDWKEEMLLKMDGMSHHVTSMAGAFQLRTAEEMGSDSD